MSYNRKKFLWTDALRLMLIKEVKQRPTIWSSSSNNFNNMSDKMAYQITKKLHEVSTGICELTVNHIKDEWKDISNECVRVLNRNDELKRSELSIWRFGYVLKFMLYAVTHAEEGNAYVLLYIDKLNIFCVVRESDIVGVLWPFSNVSVQLKGKVERAIIMEIGRRHVMIEKCKHISVSKNSRMVWNDRLTEAHMLPDKFAVQTKRYNTSLMRRDDEIVYYDSGAHYSREIPVKNAPSSLRMPDVGESKPFSALQLLLQNQTLSKQHLFHGIPSSILAHVDSELCAKRRQHLLQSEPSVSCSRPILQRRAVTSFVERHHDTNPIFPASFSRTPTRVMKQMEYLNYNCGRLLRRLDNIRCEADGLKCMVVAVKRDIDRDFKMIMLRFLCASQLHVYPVVPMRGAASEKEVKSVLMQTDEVLDKEDGFFHVGKVYGDKVYKYCPREIVRGLVATSSHPTAFVRRLAQHIFSREEISVLFSENMKTSQVERIQWIETMISIWYPRKKLSSLHKSCLQALSALADYETLLLELEKKSDNLDNSKRHSVPVKRMRLDDACSSTYEQSVEKNQSQGDYLLPQTLSRIKRQQKNAEGFVVKVATLLYSGDDDIQKPCKEKRNQAKLIWLKEKVQELYPADTMRNVNYQWSRCLDALDTHADKMKNVSFDEYDSSDEIK
ncbi:hypothetical protein LOAG_07427 [Loa loa]|uniref:MADF domain-containing protein n=1 Tax=Loa loa TaxID=7209 RepID=A0A1I7W3P5_LOALO|nr:hypothetical protein LOAG_07427 [Loa loa]EFO21065.1 hypothetical protein LOAG_07427 [Loa loa]